MTEYIDKTEAMRRFKPFGREIPKEQVMAVLARIEALNREPSEDGTLEVKVEDATKVGRVLITDDKHRGGLYYPDEDEPQSVSFENDTKIKSCSKDGDLISRAEAIEALGEEPPVWCYEDYEIAERDQWRADIEAIKSVPSADRPRGEWVNTAPSDRSDNIICDQCGYNSIARYNYCPDCGADMRTTKGER